MDTGAARAFFEQYAAAVAFVEVQDTAGRRRIGSAFHVGEGVFLTARHVVENCSFHAIGSTESIYVTLEKGVESSMSIIRNGVKQPAHHVHNETMSLKSGPFFHCDDAVNVAVFQVDKLDPLTPVIPLGGHLDDWLGESDFVLTEAVILGYLPIPNAKRNSLIGTQAEVNALVDLRDTPHVHFALSAMARGDFSGGPVLSEYGYALGMVTGSMAVGSDPAAFQAAIGVEPLYECLAAHGILPDCQAEMWNGLWDD